MYRGGGEYGVYAHAPLVYWRHMRDCDVLLDAENGIPFFTPLFSRRPKALVMFHVHRHVLLAELPKPINILGWFLEAVLMPFVYRHVSFIAISESTRDDIQKYKYTKRPIALIHSGIDHGALGEARQKSTIPQVVYVGRVVRYKRVPRLIEEFARVRESLPEAQLVIAGRGGDLAGCKAVVERLGLGQAVRFEGWISEARKRELLSSAWVFAHPSRMEGWGISIIEAAACATPAVSMRVQGLQDAILNGETGLLADDWDGFGDSLLRILTDDELREKFSRNALRHSFEFTWETTAKQTLAVLSGLKGIR